MTTRVFRPVLLGAVGALVLGACGGEESVGSQPALRPPVAVEVAAVGGTGSLQAASEDAAADAIDPSLSRIGWFVGFDYEIGDGLTALPSDSTGYQYPAGSDVDAAVVQRLGAALGVEGEPVRGGGSQVDGVVWRIGTDDGTEPSLTVLSDGQLSWYYSSAWQRRDDVIEDVGEIDPGERPQPEEISPPPGILTAPEAEARAAAILEASIGSQGLQLESFADEWFASVTAHQMLGTLRAPMAWSFGFGAEGALEWASGNLTSPVPAGPYPLVDLEQAVERLRAQGGGSGSFASPEPAVIEPGDEPILTDDMLVDDLPATDAPLPGEFGEPTIETAVLVAVAADLWWAWDQDGSVWLLPAYTFTDTEGRTHTVPAVADEYLIQATEIYTDEPDEMVDPVEGGGTDSAEPGTPGEEIGAGELPVDPELEFDAEVLIGMPVDKAEITLREAGGILRVLRLDGEDLAATMDFAPSRINVAVDDGIVSEILSTG